MPSTAMQSPRAKKAAGGPPPTAMPQPQHKRSSLRYSLNNIGKAFADVVGKDSKASTHMRIPSSTHLAAMDRSATSSSLSADPPLRSRRPSIAGAFEDNENNSSPPTRASSQAHVRTRTMSTTRGLTQHKVTPTKLSTPAVIPVSRRRSLLVKGALAAPAAAAPTQAAAPTPVGTAKILIRPKTVIPRAQPTEEERPVEVKERERRTDSPRTAHAAVGRTREHHDSRASPVRAPSSLQASTPKGRASPVRSNSNDQTPNAAKDDRERRRERREREKQAQEEKEREKRNAKEREKERERMKQLEVGKAQEALAQRAATGHRTSSSTTTLTSASSIFTTRSSTGDSNSSGGSARPSPQASKAQATVFPRAAQTVTLTPPDDEEEEDEDITISTPMTRSRTVTGSTNFGDMSTPAISKTLLASISAQTESPILAPLDQHLRRAGSIPSLSSALPSPVNPGSMPFPPPATMRNAGNPVVSNSNDEDDEDWEEGDVSALLETCISPLKGQSTPAMPRFAIKSSSRSRMPDPRTPSRTNLPKREALSYASPAIPASIQRVKGDKPSGKANHLNPLQQQRGPRESILSWDALIERSRLDEGELEDMLRAPPPAVGLISPDMRPARSLPPLAGVMHSTRMTLAGISDSEAEIEEEREDEVQGERFFTPGADKTAGANTSGGQSISQVLFPPPASPEKKSKSRTKEREREMAEKERAWAAKEEAWRAQQTEWDTERSKWDAERSKWEVERAQWDAQQDHWTTQRSQWNTQHAQWSTQQVQWEVQRDEWTARENELLQAVQARDDDLEAYAQESSAHASELVKQSSAHETLMQQVKKQMQDLRIAQEREAKVEAQMRCLAAMNAWTGVLGGLKADKEACAANRAALKVLLLGLEAMVRP